MTAKAGVLAGLALIAIAGGCGSKKEVESGGFASSRLEGPGLVASCARRTRPAERRASAHASSTRDLAATFQARTMRRPGGCARATTASIEPRVERARRPAPCSAPGSMNESKSDAMPQSSKSGRAVKTATLDPTNARALAVSHFETARRGDTKGQNHRKPSGGRLGTGHAAAAAALISRGAGASGSCRGRARRTRCSTAAAASARASGAAEHSTGSTS
jgi:hypothetical protein